MKSQLTKSQVDRLGERLRNNLYNETDLKLLDDFRRSFHEAYETTLKTIRDRTSLEPTGRPAKSTTAIIEKLKRESIRLSQIQDIAGCRTVVGTIIDQNQIVSSLLKLFPNSDVIDRRLHPSHGYRGVHFIVKVDEQSIEIQVRSMLQHLWAEFSEKLADVIDPSIKYGGGDENIRELLQQQAVSIATIENLELDNADLEKKAIDSIIKLKLEKLKERVGEVKREMGKSLKEAIGIYSKL